MEIFVIIFFMIPIAVIFLTVKLMMWQRKMRKQIQENYTPLQFDFFLTHENEHTIITKVVGVTFENRQTTLERCANNQQVIILHKPIKKYPHAMLVCASFKALEEEIGYLKDDLAEDLYFRYKESHGENFSFLGYIKELKEPTEGYDNFGCIIEFYDREVCSSTIQ